MPRPTTPPYTPRSASERLRRRPTTYGRRRPVLRGLVALAVAVAGVAALLPARDAGEGGVAAQIVGEARTLVSRDEATGAATRTGDDDGYIAKGGAVSPFDDGLPAIRRLDPELRRAVQAAARAAETDGITMVVTSGWRSARYQRLLLDRAVQTYGREAAARLVLPPERSEHVRGEAVDVGPTDAALWLGQHGTRFGLCQTYANESWHFQRTTTRGGPCPLQLSDASQR